MAAATVVPPRVVPLFLHEYQSTTTELKLVNLRHFHQNMAEIFKCRVEVEDVMDLLTVLFNELGNEADEYSGTIHSEVQLLSLRIMLEMFTRGSVYSPLCFKALRRMSLKDVAEEDEVPPPPAKQPVAETPQAVERPKSSAGAPNDEEAANKPRPAASSPTSAEDPESEGEPQNRTVEGLSPIPKSQTPAPSHSPVPKDGKQGGGQKKRPLSMDSALGGNATRASSLELLRAWDASGIDVSCFTNTPETMHQYLPNRLTSPAKVYRDFLTCPRRPKLTRTWGAFSCVHIKTSIPAKSDVMYRFLVEGYNYGVNAVVQNDAVGYTNRRWDDIGVGQMAQYGYPEGWDAEMCNDYAPGATISQYYTKDRYLALRLKAKSMFCIGFSVSAWLVFHGYGNGISLSAEVFHQDEDL